MCDEPAPNNENCEVHIEATITTEKKELKCYEGDMVSQAVVGQLKDMVIMSEGKPASCGVRLTNENWKSKLKLPIAATIDGHVDGDYERDLVIKASVWVKEKKVKTMELTTIKVTSSVM